MIRHYFKLIWKRKSKNAFLLAELVLVFLVVFGVGTFTASIYKNYSKPNGFNSDDVYRLSLNIGDIESDTTRQRFLFEEIKNNILALDGVETVSYSVYISPYLGNTWSNGTDGKDDGSNFEFNTDYLHGDENYDDVWKVKMASGRFYSKGDEAGRYIPAIVNQVFVDKWMKGKEPLGFVFKMSGKEAQIIGVAEAFKYGGDFKEEVPFTFFPLSGLDHYQMMSIRTKPGTGADIQKRIHDTVEKITKTSDFSISKSSDERKSVNNRTMVPLVALLFLVLFLVINIAMGLFGVLRYNISKRIPEIGLRKALGAPAGKIRRQFTGEMLVLTFISFAVALLIALQVAYFTVIPFTKEALTTGILGGAILIFLIVYLCTILPSHQAAGILPAKALREE